MSNPRFEPGEPIVWRSCQKNHIGYVLAAIVLVDSPELIAFYQPTGGPVLKRGGVRSGPRNRSLTADGWDGSHLKAIYKGLPSIRVHQSTCSYSVIRHINNGNIEGWYANPENPWRRTSIGYDSKDLTVDIEFNGDLSSPTLKDLDELEWLLENDSITEAEYNKSLEAAKHASDSAVKMRGAFATDWNELAKLSYKINRGMPELSIPRNALTLPAATT